MIFQKIIASFLFLHFSPLLLAAQNIDLNKMSEDQVFSYMETSLDSMIGEACGVGGFPSDSYSWTTACIKESKINLVRRLIYSKNPAVQFFASLLCETLEKEGLISLSVIEKESINQIKKSETKVTTCSGCDYFASRSLSSMYDCRSGICVASEEFRMWANGEVKEYADRKKMDEKIFLYVQDSTENEMGFGCGPAGVMTESIRKMTALMEESNIRVIRNLIYSTNPSAQFLAAQVCGRLEEEELIVMTKEEKKKITAIRISSAITNVCSGCDVNREISLKDLWNAEEKEISKFRKGVESWVKQQVRLYEKSQKEKK